MANELIPTTKIAVFRKKEIRKTIHNNQWWFSITDVVAALTDSTDTKQYIKKMRQRDPALSSYWGTICTPLELTAPDGKMRETNCAIQTRRQELSDKQIEDNRRPPRLANKIGDNYERTTRQESKIC